MIYKASDLPWHEIHKSTLFFLLKKKNVISFDWISFQNYFISFLFVGISFYLVITEENILCSPSTLSSLITLLLVGGLKVSVCRQDSVSYAIYRWPQQFDHHHSNHKCSGAAPSLHLISPIDSQSLAKHLGNTHFTIGGCITSNMADNLWANLCLSNIFFKRSEVSPSSKYSAFSLKY